MTEMEIIYLLIPISLLLVAVIIYLLFWAIRSGQFDDMEGSGFQILTDDDDPHDVTKKKEHETR